MQKVDSSNKYPYKVLKCNVAVHRNMTGIFIISFIHTLRLLDFTENHFILIKKISSYVL